MMKVKKKKILDVGCGTAKVTGAIGIDRVKMPGVDIVHDLNIFPWPLDDNSFDAIYLNDIIEHLQDQLKVIEEVHRILKPQGLLHVRVVYWNHKYSFSDPTHVHYYTEIIWDFFTGKRRNYYTTALFKLERLHYHYSPAVRKFFRSERILKFLSKYLCNVCQGMNVSLRKLK